jgi:hypothetical protein
MESSSGGKLVTFEHTCCACFMCTKACRSSIFSSGLLVKALSHSLQKFDLWHLDKERLSTLEVEQSISASQFCNHLLD